MIGSASILLHPIQYYEQLFSSHIEQFKLDFEKHELLHRFSIFSQMVDTIETHNADESLSYKLGLNQFSHLTFNEFKQSVGLETFYVDTNVNTDEEITTDKDFQPTIFQKNRDELHSKRGAGGYSAIYVNVSDLPTAIDWVEKGAVTPVKNQGQCGSCWAFSTTGSLEGAYFNKWGQLKSFSEQELVSCDRIDQGCNGGLMDTAFDFVKHNGGLASESDYPYTSGTGVEPKCLLSLSASQIPQDSKVAPTGHIDVEPGNIAALQAAVAKNPVSIAIEADQPAFQSYKSGVFNGRCGQNLDHGVLLVGYGTMTVDDKKQDYWKVKNSWGASWGLGGYILIERSEKNLCGVLDSASYPVL